MEEGKDQVPFHRDGIEVQHLPPAYPEEMLIFQEVEVQVLFHEGQLQEHQLIRQFLLVEGEMLCQISIQTGQQVQPLLLKAKIYIPMPPRREVLLIQDLNITVQPDRILQAIVIQE